MKSAGKARNNGLYRHIRTSKEIIRNLLNDSTKTFKIGTESSSGAKSYLDFSKDCFTKGNTTVTIKANDYKDLTFTVTVDADGNLSIK